MEPQPRAPVSLRQATSNTQRDALLSEVRTSRETRELERRQRTHALVVQRSVRRWLRHVQARRGLMAELTKKLRDVEMLEAVMNNRAAPSSSSFSFTPSPSPGSSTHFVLPVRASRELVNQYLVTCKPSPLAKRSQGLHEGTRRELLISLCRRVLLPGFECGGKLCGAWLEGNVGQLQRVVSMLLGAIPGINFSDDKDPLAIVLEVLRAPGVASRVEGARGQECCATFVVPPLFSVIRHVCISHEATFFHPSKQSVFLISRSKNMTSGISRPFALLFALTSDVLLGAQLKQEQTGQDSTTGISPHRRGYRQTYVAYVRLLLTIPLFAHRSAFDHAPFLASLVDAWGTDDILPLPPSPFPAGSSNVWLASNVSIILAAALPRVGTSSANYQSVWMDGLGFWGRLLRQCPPSVASDEGILSFEKRGAYLTTHAVDPLIVATVQGTFKEEFLRTLLLWVFGLAAYDDDRASALLKASQRQEDKVDARRALHSSALDLTFASHKAQQALDSAQWYSRLGRRLWGSVTSEPHEGIEQGMESDDARTSTSSPSAVGGDPRALDSLCEFIAVVLWKCHSVEAQKGRGGSANPIKRQVLSTLAFSGPTSKRLWVHLLTQYAKELRNVDRVSFANGAGMEGNASFLQALVVWAAVFNHELQLLSDEDLEMGKPLARPHIVYILKTLKMLCFRGCLAQADSQQRQQQQQQQPTTTTTPDGGANSTTTITDGVSDVPYSRFVLATLCRLLRALYDRWVRKAFCAHSVWALDEAKCRSVRRALRDQAPLGKLLLHLLPFTVPFSERLALFRQWVQTEKHLFQDGRPPVVVRIRRGALLDDGLALLNTLPKEHLKRRVVVIYISEAGTQESGIDLGGLLKDVITDLSRVLFDPALGLFTSNREGFLYPNPIAPLLHDDYATLFEFAGKIVGKAIFEKMVVAPLFLPMVLGHLRGNYDYMQMLNDLADVDSTVHKNLLFLQRCDDATAVEDLGLGFAVSHLDLGTQREEELVPGGAQVPVTSTNRLNYIHLVAKHHVVDRLALQSQAFCRGFHQVVSPQQLQLFNQCELQLLVSGSISGGWDVEDLRHHCRYGQGYRGADKSVRRLWQVLLEFDDQQRRQFMRYVTSSERAPLGGFANLDPPFTIIRVSLARGDEQRLPTARTCFNELLWPSYSSKQTAKAKLLQAISSGAGFELS